MTLPTAYRRAAQVEFDKSFDWYERKRVGLGVRFVDAVQDRLDVIAADPLRFAIVALDIREADVPGFRYYRIYYVAEPTRILILSVFHTRRNPRIWKRRRNAP